MIKTTNYLVRGRIVTDFFELGEAEAEAWLCETGENSGGVWERRERRKEGSRLGKRRGQKLQIKDKLKKLEWLVHTNASG